MEASLVFDGRYFLNWRFCSCSRLFSLGMEDGPMPCRDSISFSLYFDSCCSVVMPLPSSARLAGPLRLLMKLSLGLRAASHTGQVGQSLLL